MFRRLATVAAMFVTAAIIVAYAPTRAGAQEATQLVNSSDKIGLDAALTSEFSAAAPKKTTSSGGGAKKASSGGGGGAKKASGGGGGPKKASGGGGGPKKASSGGGSKKVSTGGGSKKVGTGTGTGKKVGTGTGTGTGKKVGTGTGTGTGKKVGTGAGTGTGTGKKVGTGTGTGTGKKLGTGPGTGTGKKVGTGTGTGTGKKLGTGPGTGKKVGTGPGTGKLGKNINKNINKNNVNKNFNKNVHVNIVVNRGPNRFWRNNRWVTFVGIGTLAAITFNSAFYDPDGYVAIARPYCSGVTVNGCRLNWQSVALDDGSEDVQCVQYCPRRVGSTIPIAPVAAVAVAAPAQARGSCETVIYSEPNLKGESAPTDEDQPKLSEVGWQGEISSIEVKSGTWDFYPGEDYAGAAMRLAPGSYNQLAPEWTKKIGSFQCVNPS